MRSRGAGLETTETLVNNMFGLGEREIIIVAVILVLLFGASKIPQLAGGIADAIKHLRHGFKDSVDDDKKGSK